MKTSSSFFPTRTHLNSQQKPRQHKEHVVQVFRPKVRACTSPKSDDEGFNIFKDQSNPAFKQENNNPNFRPVGGEALFKKIVQNKQHLQQQKKNSKRNIKECTVRSIATANFGSRFKRQRNDIEDNYGSEMLPLKSINQNEKGHAHTVMVDQFFKSHASYDASYSSSKIKKNTLVSKSTMKSQNKTRPKTGKVSNHAEWASAQSKEYHDKAALLNEINYNKPLVERYGDKYFEYILRNRFEDDLKPPPYIYLLSGKKFSDTKVISKIKHQRPDLRDRQMMMLKGRKMGFTDQS